MVNVAPGFEHTATGYRGSKQPGNRGVTACSCTAAGSEDSRSVAGHTENCSDGRLNATTLVFRA